MKYLLKSHWPMICFGIVMITFTGPGQTFLIALFVNPMFKDLNISQSMFAGIYSLATIIASVFLNPMGRLIDKLKPILTVLLVIIMMSLGCIILSLSYSIYSLFTGFLVLRLFGQGVFILLVSSFIVKAYKKNRGKMLGLITLGYPLSELIYPFLSQNLILSVGWRDTYLYFAISNVIILLPLSLFFIYKSAYLPNTFYTGEIIETELNKPIKKSYFLGEATRDYSFYLIILASCVPPVLITGLFFHQENIFNLNNWPVHLIASGIAIYAVTKALSALLIGPIIDKKGPLIPFIFLILLLAVVALFSCINGNEIILFFYFALAGIALGVSAPTMNVIWPNLYGTKHIGSIKGFVATFRNGLTAIGPLPIALVLDYGYSLRSLLFITAISICFISVIPYLVSLKNPRLNETGN